MSETIFRDATIADLEATHKIYKQDRNNPYLVEGGSYSIEEFRDYVGSTHCRLLVAESDGKVVGFCLAYDLINWCYIDIFCIAESYRGHGLGSEFLNFIETLNPKWVIMELCYEPGDLQIEKFLEKNGYVEPEPLVWRIKPLDENYEQRILQFRRDSNIEN